MRATKAAAVLMLLCTGMMSSSRASAGPIPPTFYNEDIYNNLGPQDNYEIVFAGNQTGNLTPLINPFPHGTTSVTYDPVLDRTTMTFAGDYVPGGHTYHFGYSEVGGIHVPHGYGSPDIVQQYWTPGVEYLPAPTITVGVAPPVIGAGIFLIGYVEGAFIAADGYPYFPYVNGWWFEQWVPFGVLFPLNFWNFLTDDPDIDGFAGIRPMVQPLDDDDEPSLQLGKVEYFFSPTQIPLSDLNLSSLPPTDPRFQSLPSLDGTVLDPGDSVTAYIGVVPEPASLTLLGMGAVVLGGYGWRRRKS